MIVVMMNDDDIAMTTIVAVSDALIATPTTSR